MIIIQTKVVCITMSSTVVLTPEIREIPYFSSFSIDEKEVVIPRPMINESINYKNTYPILEDIKMDDLLTTIENRIYLNLDTEELILELLWRLGESEEKMKSIEKLSTIIQTELKPHLTKENSIYVYGIRCKIPIGVVLITYLVSQGGSIRLLKWARKLGIEWNERTCEVAAEKGRLDILKYLHENGCPWDESTCVEAANSGRLDILKYARENNEDTGSSGNTKCPWSGNVYIYAVESGCIDILKYALENNCPIYYKDSVCNRAAYKGHLHILKWAIDNNFPCGEFTMDNAASQGHIDIIKWLHEKGYNWDESTCSEAAFGGHLHIVKYLHENGCPWDVWTTAYAIVYEHNNILEYARENNCPEDDFAIMYVYNDKMKYK